MYYSIYIYQIYFDTIETAKKQIIFKKHSRSIGATKVLAIAPAAPLITNKKK